MRNQRMTTAAPPNAPRGGLDVMTRSTTGLLDQQLSSLVEISHHLFILDDRKLVMTCTSLWTNRHRMEGDRRTVVVQRPSRAKLETLALGDWVNDEFLAAVELF
jgi:hypothetical protein